MFWRGRFCSLLSQRFRVLISHITFWKFGSIGLTLQSVFPLHLDCLSTQPRRQRDVEGERERVLFGVPIEDFFFNDHTSSQVCFQQKPWLRRACTFRLFKPPQAASRTSKVGDFFFFFFKPNLAPKILRKNKLFSAQGPYQY